MIIKESITDFIIYFQKTISKKIKTHYPESFEIELRNKAYEWYIKNDFINEALEQVFILQKKNQNIGAT